MKLKGTLQNLFEAVAQEAERSPVFAKQLESVLGINSDSEDNLAERNPDQRASHRRNPAVLDPVSIARQGEVVLRKQLEPLSLEQLKDIVAQHGMDPDKLAMKWKTSDRIINRIVEYSLSRSKKGEVFLR